MEFRTILGKASPPEKGKFPALADSSLASSPEPAGTLKGEEEQRAQALSPVLRKFYRPGC